MGIDLRDGISGNVETQSELAKKEKVRVELDALALRQVLETDTGRRVLARIVGFTHLERPAFNGEPLVMAHNLGAQGVGAAIRAWVRAHGRDLWRVIEDEMEKDR